MRVVTYGDPDSLDNFEQFCENNGIKLVARERSRHSGLPRWYVSGEPLVEIREGGLLTATHGNGSTPEEARDDYARQLAGHRLLVGGYSGYEVIVPNEFGS